MTAVSVTSMALFVDLGVGNGLLTRVSVAFGASDWDGARAYVTSAYVMLFAVAAFWGGVAVLLWAVFNEIGADQFGHGLSASELSVAFICIGAFLLSLPASVIQRVMYATQQAWLANVWQALGAVAAVALCLLVIRHSSHAWLAVAVYSVAPTIVLWVAAIEFFRRRVEIRPRIKEFSVSRSRDLLGLGLRFFLLSVVTSTALNLDYIIIANKLGPAAVTEYAVPAKLGSLLGLLVTALFLPLWAANGDALASNDYAWVRRTCVKMSLVGSAVVLVAGVLLVIFSDSILNLWMGRSFDGQRSVLFWLAVASVLMAVGSPYQMLLNASDTVIVQVMAWLAFLGASLTLKLILVQRAELWIVPMVTAVCYAATVLPVVINASRRLLTRGPH